MQIFTSVKTKLAEKFLDSIILLRIPFSEFYCEKSSLFSPAVSVDLEINY